MLNTRPVPWHDIELIFVDGVPFIYMAVKMPHGTPYITDVIMHGGKILSRDRFIKTMQERKKVIQWPKSIRVQNGKN